MQAKYTDPMTGIYFNTSEEFQLVRTLPTDIVQGYLALRGKLAITWQSHDLSYDNSHDQLYIHYLMSQSQLSAKFIYTWSKIYYAIKLLCNTWKSSMLLARVLLLVYRGSILSWVVICWAWRHGCVAEEPPECGSVQPSPARATQLSPAATTGPREFKVHSEHRLCRQGGDLAVESSLSQGRPADWRPLLPLPWGDSKDKNDYSESTRCSPILVLSPHPRPFFKPCCILKDLARLVKGRVGSNFLP